MKTQSNEYDLCGENKEFAVGMVLAFNSQHFNLDFKKIQAFFFSCFPFLLKTGKYC